MVQTLERPTAAHAEGAGDLDGSPQKSLVEAIHDTLAEELRADERVVVLGEDVGRHGGIFQVTKDLIEEFGPERVLDTPIAEQGVSAAAVGAALAGLRPVLEVMFNDFATLAMDQVVNEAAKMRYMTGGQVTVPLTVRTTTGTARSAAAHHSQSLYAWFCHVPGLSVVLPSTPQDAYGLLRSSIRRDAPVVVFEDKQLYQRKGTVDLDTLVPLGSASVVRPGRDVTVIATGRYVPMAVEVAEALAPAVEVEVLDPRTLWPLDADTILESARRTRRVVVVDFDHLDAPVVRVAGREVVIPFSPPLEQAAVPGADDIRAAVLGLTGGA
jgi:pyruvate/2-oxoglutarate/acetoin dehydrogenase E1 component